MTRARPISLGGPPPVIPPKIRAASACALSTETPGRSSVADRGATSVPPCSGLVVGGLWSADCHSRIPSGSKGADLDQVVGQGAVSGPDSGTLRFRRSSFDPSRISVRGLTLPSQPVRHLIVRRNVGRCSCARRAAAGLPLREPSNGIRQNRRQVIGSLTSRHKVS